MGHTTPSWVLAILDGVRSPRYYFAVYLLHKGRFPGCKSVGFLSEKRSVCLIGLGTSGMEEGASMHACEHIHTQIRTHIRVNTYRGAADTQIHWPPQQDLCLGPEPGRIQGYGTGRDSNQTAGHHFLHFPVKKNIFNFPPKTQNLLVMPQPSSALQCPLRLNAQHSAWPAMPSCAKRRFWIPLILLLTPSTQYPTKGLPPTPRFISALCYKWVKMSFSQDAPTPWDLPPPRVPHLPGPRLAGNSGSP